MYSFSHSKNLWLTVISESADRSETLADIVQFYKWFDLHWMHFVFNIGNFSLCKLAVSSIYILSKAFSFTICDTFYDICWNISILCFVSSFFSRHFNMNIVRVRQLCFVSFSFFLHIFSVQFCSQFFLYTEKIERISILHSCFLIVPFSN